MDPVDQAALFILAGALGFFLSRTRSSGRFAGAVSILNVWIALPGLFFVIYVTRGIVSQDIGIVTFSAVFTLATVWFLLNMSKGMTGAVRGAVVLNGSFVNAINLPFPILQVMMGTYTFAATFAATTSAIQIVAARLLQRHLKTGSGGGARASFTRAAPLVALGAGALLHYAIWPAAPSISLSECTDLIENFLIAAIFLHFGVALGRSLVGSGRAFGLGTRPFLATALARCVLGPVLALVLAIPLGVGSPVYLQMVFVATMPPAIVNTLIARVYGFDADSSAKWTTILTPINTVEAVALLLILNR